MAVPRSPYSPPRLYETDTFFCQPLLGLDNWKKPNGGNSIVLRIAKEKLLTNREGAQKLIYSGEVWTHCANFVDYILQTDDTLVTQLLFHHGVRLDGRLLAVDAGESLLEDQLANGAQRGIAVDHKGFDNAQQQLVLLGVLHEDGVVARAHAQGSEYIRGGLVEDLLARMAHHEEQFGIGIVGSFGTLFGDIGAQNGLLDPLGRALCFQVAHYEGFGTAEFVVILGGGSLFDAVISFLRNNRFILQNSPLAML